MLGIEGRVWTIGVYDLFVVFSQYLVLFHLLLPEHGLEVLARVSLVFLALVSQDLVSLVDVLDQVLQPGVPTLAAGGGTEVGLVDALGL